MQVLIFPTFALMRHIFIMILFLLLSLAGSAQFVKWKDALLSDPSTITHLDCSGLKWDSVPAELFRFSALRQLDLSKNKLTELPVSFASLKQLEQLNLGRNQFEVFPLIVCQLYTLKTLHLDRNKLSHLPEQLADLQQLEHLDLYANGIEHFGEGIFTLPALRVLNIEGVMYGTIFAKQLTERLTHTKVLIDPPCKCLD